MMDNQHFSYLEQLIKLVCDNHKYHICIYDIAGIIFNMPTLSLPRENQFHTAPFCLAVKKSNEGMRFCLKCKYTSFHKVAKQDSAFVGRCYLGITEIVRPVFINGKLACIIYLGNILLDEKKDDTYLKIEKHERLLGIDKNTLISELASVETLSAIGVEECLKTAELLHDSILYAYRFHQHSPALVDYNKNPQNFFVQTAMNYIECYYTADIKIEHVAQLLFINPNYLRGVFRKQTGTHFVDYLNKTRVKNACELLLHSNSSITQIASEVGFNHVSYFNRLFKAYNGCSPREFRNTYRETQLPMES